MKEKECCQIRSLLMLLEKRGITTVNEAIIEIDELREKTLEKELDLLEIDSCKEWLKEQEGPYPRWMYGSH